MVLRAVGQSEDFNAQRHWAHESREDGRRSPEAVLGFYTALLRPREEDLRRAFFSTRHARVLDALGYVRFLDWRLYGEEGLARREAAVWLQPGSLTLEYGGAALSAYDVELSRESGTSRRRSGARGCSEPPTSCRNRGSSRLTRPAGSRP